MSRFQKSSSVGASARVFGGLRIKGLRTVLLSTIALTPTMYGNAAQAAAPQDAAVEEVVVTGTRIVREGYEAPTPLTVVGAAALETSADANIAKTLFQMPIFAGTGIGGPNSTSLTNGGNGSDNANMRNLGPERTLVLMDGNRVVGSSASGQLVDTGGIPSQLVQRVDVVTGGGSAVYGSDAVAGVVNFILDREFTGIKGDVSGGITSYGDGANYTLKLSGGFAFGGGRGHVLLSGGSSYNAGGRGDEGRTWAHESNYLVVNPAWNATTNPTVPQYLRLNHVGVINQTLGGAVLSGPLKGTAFGQGGVPFTINTGTLQSSNQFQGGDWQISDARVLSDVIGWEKRQDAFLRISYDVTDNISGYVSSFWTRNHTKSIVSTTYTSTAASSPTIKRDNAFLPASVLARMVAANVTQFQVGSINPDLQVVPDFDRRTQQNTVGFEGNFDAFGSNWKWDAHGTYGISLISQYNQGVWETQLWLNATDAVVNPATGTIVCRVKLTDPSSLCQPWNPMGVGVNEGNDAGRKYIYGEPIHANNKVELGNFAASITGDAFSLPAGPVSIALGLEHRIDTVHDHPNPHAIALLYLKGNPAFIDAKQTVNEGSFETVVPLFKDMPFAVNWDLNAAVRATDYSLAGYVTTWKVGTTYSPIDDIRFRVTRSRDIRAPNLYELFLSGTNTISPIDDPFTGQRVFYRGFATGNINLKPEKADTTGIGVVLSPSFLDGFTASVDYWNVSIKGAINNPSAASILNSCYDGSHPEFCSAITRVAPVAPATLGQLDVIKSIPFNIGLQQMRGIDVESSYRFGLSQLTDSLDGDVSLHGNATFYLRNIIKDGIGVNNNAVGINNNAGVPNWRLNVNLNYDLDPISVQLTGRAVGKGVVSSTYVECTSACPRSVNGAQTLNDNSLPSALYFDANIQYKFAIGDADTTAYFSARNIFNKDGVPIPTQSIYSNAGISGGSIYDIFGTVFRAGLRFKL